MKQDRSFKLDKETGKYVLLLKQSGAIPDEQGMDEKGEPKNAIAMQTSETKQVWEEAEVHRLLDQVKTQEKKVNEALEKTREGIKKIGKFDERERNMLKDFKRNLERVQELQTLEKLEVQKKSQFDMLTAIQKDMKEITDVLPKEESTKPVNKEVADETKPSKA